VEAFLPTGFNATHVSVMHIVRENLKDAIPKILRQQALEFLVATVTGLGIVNPSLIQIVFSVGGPNVPGTVGRIEEIINATPSRKFFAPTPWKILEFSMGQDNFIPRLHAFNKAGFFRY
jgi:hypothetical protein